MSNEDRALHPGASRTRTPDLLWRCMALAAGPACGAWLVHSAAEWTTWAKACEAVVFIGCPFAAIVWYAVGDD